MFMQRLTFEAGILVKIETIGYGYREKKSPSQKGPSLKAL